MTRQDALDRAAAGRLAGADLAGVPLAKADLSGANLQKIAAAGVRLRGAALRGADLAGANLAGADLREADLTGANLAGADLRGARLRECRLARVQAADATAAGADFSVALLQDADFSRADLRGAKFYGAALDRVNFAGADLSRAEFDGAEFREVNFAGANLERATLHRVYGQPLAALEALQARGALIDWFLFRRLLRVLRRSLAAKIVAAAAIAALGAAGWQWFGEPDHWSYETLQRRAEERFHRGEIERAVALEQMIVRRFGADRNRAADARLAIAGGWRARGRIDQALAAYEEIAAAYAGAPQAREALEAMGRIDEERGDQERTRVVFERLAQTAAGDADAARQADFALAGVLAKEGKKVEALAQYDALFVKYRAEKDAGDRALLASISLLCELARFDEADAALARLQQYDVTPHGFEARLDGERKIVEALRRRGDLAAAAQRSRAVYETYRRGGPDGGDEAPELFPPQGEARYRQFYQAGHGAERVREFGFLLVEIDQQQAKISEAETRLAELGRRAASDDPGRFYGLQMAQARLCLDHGRVAAGEAIYRAIMTQRPSAELAAQAALDLAGAWRRRGERAAAARLLRETMADDRAGGRRVSAAMELADLLVEEKRFADADAALAGLARKFAAGADERADLVLRRAQLLAQQDRVAAAIALVDAERSRFASRAKRLEAQRVVLGLQAGRGDMAAAEATYRALAKEFAGDPALAGVQVDLGQRYVGRQMTAPALALFAAAAQDPHTDAGRSARWETAALLAATGEPAKAASIFDELIAEPGGPPQALQAGLAYAALLEQQQRWDDLDRLFARLRAIWPQQSGERDALTLRQAAVLRRRERPADAAALLEKALDGFADREGLYQACEMLLTIARAAGDEKRAAATLARIAAAFPDDPGRLARARDNQR